MGVFLAQLVYLKNNSKQKSETIRVRAGNYLFWHSHWNRFGNLGNKTCYRAHKKRLTTEKIKIMICLLINNFGNCIEYKVLLMSVQDTH